MDKDLNLQLQIKKDQARQELASFGAAAKQMIATDLSEAQIAERAKVEVTKASNRERIREAANAIKAESDLKKQAAEADLQAAKTAANARANIEKETFNRQDTARRRGVQAEEQMLTETTAAAQRAAAARASFELEAFNRQDTARRRGVAAEWQMLTEMAAAAQQAANLKANADTEVFNRADTARRRGAREEEQMLREMAAAAEKAAGVKKAAADKGVAALAAEKAAAKDLGVQLMAVGQIFQQIGSWAHSAMQAVAQSMQESRSHIKGMVDEMESARKGLRELAALRGEEKNGATTAKIAREAAAAGLDVEEYKEVQLGFQAQAGQYVGEEGATPEQLAAGGKKISKDQAQALQGDVASFAVGAKGLSGDSSTRLMGTVLAKSAAGATNEQLLSQYAKIMKIAELAPGRTSEIVGQLSELGMESVGPTGDFKNLEQSAYLTRVMAQRNPAEASTYGRGVLRGLRDIGGNEEKRGELGITKDMDVMQQLEQINVKAQEHVAGGGKENEFIQKYFPEIREFGGVRTALDEGIRGGGFKRAQVEAASVNADTVRSDIRGYKGSVEGKSAGARSQIVADERQNASFYEPLKQIQREQEALLLQSHELERPESWAESIMTKEGQIGGWGDRKEQQIRKRTAYDIDSRLMMSGEGRQWLTTEFGHDKMGGGREQGHLAANASERDMGRAAQILDKIHQQGENAARQREQLAARQRPHPPVLAHPPMADRGKRW